MFLTGVIFLTIVSCYSARRLPRDDTVLTDLQKQKAFLKGNLPSNSFFSKQNLSSNSISKLNFNTTSSQTSRPTKWQVERMTKRQYGIINMLWRKTKIFVNVENTTPIHKQENITRQTFEFIQKVPVSFSSQPPILPSYKPSYIEFYYTDESDKRAKQIDFITATPKINTKMKSPLDSFLVFHIKGPLLSRTTDKKTSQLSLNDSHIKVNLSESTIKSIPNTTISNYKTSLNSSVLSTHKYIIDVTEHNNSITSQKNTQNIAYFTVSKNQTESTTVYDKIKFFELYDKHTRIPIAKKINMLEYNENTHEEYDINNYRKILLEHVDQSSHEHNEAKHSKKHIENDKNTSELYITTTDGKKLKTHMLNVTIEKQNNMTSYVTNRNFVKSKPKEFKNVYSYINQSVSWSEYPFAAVYIYKPSQIYCDAASISAHWLVASGSCLSRLNQSPVFGEGRSAFVAYCGDRWWQPERVSYVKYSVVHPWYHPKDQTRRNLYNIGVIQVVTSMMSACNEWAPVSLMSHHFAASQGGSEALALGWGLDRYDTRYAAVDFPRASLMIYKGLLFSDSCPGSIGYGKVRRFDDAGGVRNVYCLSLPPYSGEERDPIHGSMLLVGGKLTALYLQEERRPFGEQSAQYTGIWRLIPWVMETAKEPEEMESFSV